MTLIALTMTMMVASLMATMVAPMVSSRSKEEIIARGDRDGFKKRCQNGRQCHGPAVALMVDFMVEASMVASMALMASLASMVASRASVVASMASMASLVVSLEWLKRMAAEPRRGDERVNGSTHNDELSLKIEGASTVALMMASMAAAMVAPEASMVASMAPMVVVLFKWLNLMAAEPKRGDDRIDGWAPKIREEQDDGEERVDGLTFKIDKKELTGGLIKLVKNELMGGPAEKWLNRCSWTVTTPKVVDAIWLKSLPPLNYESVRIESGRNG